MTRQPLRVGSVPYLVGRPLDAGLGDEEGITLEHAVPSALVEGLRAGRLDVALVSSIELFRRPGYRYVPNLCVAGRGHVSSVQLFLHRPLEQVSRVALDPASRTSAALVEVLARELHFAAQFEEPPPLLDPRDSGADAWLRIGDTALRESLEVPALPFFNPSAEWERATGLPFVFAVWIVAPGAPFDEHRDAFARARRRGAEVARSEALEHARRQGLPASAVERYLLDECCFELGDQLHRSLIAFRDRAAVCGLVDATLTPQPVDVD